MIQVRAEDYISTHLRLFNRDLSDYLKSQVVAIRGPISFGLDDLIRLEIEALNDGHPKRKKPKKLTVILETTGGYIEVVERIYNTFRKHFRLVDFVIPNYAYSAGTVLALSGDSIFMDYYSVLGPIDPQFELEDGRHVPGLGYLQKFKELKDFINKSNGKPETYKAELAFFLKKFDPAIMFHLEQAKNHSASLLRAWLPRHKFKNWHTTKTRKMKVTARYREERAGKIAEVLSNPERWHSHGRGIGINELTNDEINLQINNFGDNKDLNEKIRRYYDLLIDFAHKVRCGDLKSTVIHSQMGLRTIPSMA